MPSALEDPDGQRFELVPEDKRTPTPETIRPPARVVDVPQPEDRRRRRAR